MKSKILEYYNNYNNAAQRLKQDDELWQWILTNCDPQSYDTNTRVYTAYSGEKLECPCGSGKLRKCLRFRLGLQFCGNAKSCTAAYNSSINKRKNTNIQKYGTEFPIQNKAVQTKIKNTMLEKYGTEFALQNHQIKRIVMGKLALVGKK